VIGLFVVAFLALLAYSTLHGPRFRVEVCMTFSGQTTCKTVNAKSQDAAVRSATENACADISSGVDDTIRCQNTEPKSVKWLKKGE
jgi:hypothetical protein